jgi:hypothetical protein
MTVSRRELLRRVPFVVGGAAVVLAGCTDRSGTDAGGGDDGTEANTDETGDGEDGDPPVDLYLENYTTGSRTVGLELRAANEVVVDGRYRVPGRSGVVFEAVDRLGTAFELVASVSGDTLREEWRVGGCPPDHVARDRDAAVQLYEASPGATATERVTGTPTGRTPEGTGTPSASGGSPTPAPVPTPQATLEFRENSCDDIRVTRSLEPYLDPETARETPTDRPSERG